MKKKIYFIILLITTVSCLAPAQEPVHFADANLKAAVEEALGVANPTPTDMLWLTELRAHQRQISHLAGLEHATNIEVLFLSDNKISDISVLADLTNLMDLHLDQNQISDISVLSNLTKLTHLGLSINQISDISVLAGLTKLTKLELNNNQIADISVLAGLRNLTSLRLGDNQISDISILARLTRIEKLWLQNIQISDISVLADMTNLVILNLQINEISDISVLAGLRNLLILHLDYNQISDISALAGLTNLRSLSLNNNQISDISVLAQKKNLERLYVLDNPLNYDACYIYIPLIRENNPGIDIRYDPYKPRIYEPHKVFVDDDGPNDPVPYNSSYSDPSEDGTYEHPFDTIQEGINVALNGELVIVREGTYRETIDFAGKSITVTGFNPDEPNAIRSYPILDANYTGTAVVFGNEESKYCLLEGFVITRGMGDIAGAISCVGSSPTISNCLIVGNRAMDPNGSGGAAFCTDSNAVFENCTFTGNYGGPLSAGLSIYDSNVEIVNSILWDNYIEVSVDSNSLPSITYSDIQGGWPGTGNMDEPPLFAAPGYWAAIEAPDVQGEPSDMNAVWIDGDYHLLSEFGRYKGRSRWNFDEVTSPCIDFGHPSTSLGQEPSPNGGVINIGAYGGTSQASKSSPTQEPVYFADADLKASVELVLGVNDPTPTNMLDLTVLDFRTRGWRNGEISDLTGLEYAKNLSQLWLSYNQISDISPLADLKNLSYLYLSQNPLNQEACDIYIPQIIENNPNIDIQYDPCNN